MKPDHQNTHCSVAISCDEDLSQIIILKWKAVENDKTPNFYRYTFQMLFKSVYRQNKSALYGLKNDGSDKIAVIK